MTESQVIGLNSLIAGFESMWEVARVLKSFLSRTDKAHLESEYDERLMKLLYKYKIAGFELNFIKI